ncbi:hypothetical protein U27_00965 [Candidatus Vecturithrix granuli]|uniref:Uncharacterized protein n=1 Tax=Vecturithrix granuli TaxID=1499967 RepID=A0A081C912_VECG1|nr:hypothetical protein U27_00965 [Candidatus Vecturithrix granuli]
MKTNLRTVPDTNVVIAAQNASVTSPNKEYLYCKLLTAIIHLKSVIH